MRAGSTKRRWEFSSASVSRRAHGQLQLEDLDRKALGSRVLFHIPAEVGYRFDDYNSLSAYFEHMSNAYTVSPNEAWTGSAFVTATAFRRQTRPLLRASCPLLVGADE